MKVEITEPIWGFKKGDTPTLTKDKAEFAIDRGRAKAIDGSYKKKVIETAPSNKGAKKKVKKQDFLGSQSFR